jgi:SAM-dependent methyltransferase
MCCSDDRFQEHGLSEAMCFARRYHQWILDTARPYIGRQICEVGAGIGNFTDMLAHLPGEAVVPLEPDAHLFGELTGRVQPYAHVRPVHATLADALPSLKDSKLDTFVYINVLEHIERDVAEMQMVHRLLADYGHVIIFVPALPALYSRIDRLLGHFRRYTKRQLLDAVQSAGFHVRACFYMDFPGMLPWYLLNTLLGKARLDPKQVRCYDACIPLIRKVESLIRPPVGKNLFLAAQKMC